jgi:hypothetical protein
MVRRAVHNSPIAGFWKDFTIYLLSSALLHCASVQAAENAEQAANNVAKTGSSVDSSAEATVETASNENLTADKESKVKSEWDKFVPPRDEKFDWIQLTSGEWLKGELRVMYNYSLEFDSDELDVQKFDWEDIKQIRSAGYQSLRIEREDRQGEPVTVIGELILVDDKVKLTADDHAIEFDRKRIVSIAKGSSNEADLWTGHVSLGLNIRSGNSDTIDSSLTANAKRRTADSRVVFDYVGNFSESESVQTSNNHRFTGYFDLFKTKKYFWRPVFGEYYRDQFKNIKNQVTAGTAFGYEIIRNSKTDWEVSGGIGVLYKQFDSVEAGEDSENTSPSVGLGTRYDTDVTSWLEYLFEFSFQIVDQQSGSYLHHLITTLESDFVSDLDIDISFVWDRVQNPQPTADGTVPEKDDFQLIVGIGYEF